MTTFTTTRSVIQARISFTSAHTHNARKEIDDEWYCPWEVKEYRKKPVDSNDRRDVDIGKVELEAERDGEEHNTKEEVRRAVVWLKNQVRCKLMSSGDETGVK